LDVGANPLDKPLYTDLVETKLCNLFGFEPQKDAFDALVASKADNETYFNVAVGQQKTQTLHICKHSGFTSLYKPDLDAAEIFPGFVNQMAVQQTFELSPVELDRVDGLPSQDMLKIDVQGAEKQIIQTGPKTLLDCVAIVIECRFARLHQGEPMFGEVDAFLRDRGYVMHKFIAPKSACLTSSYLNKLRPRMVGSQLVDGDVVYIKDITALHSFCNDQLKHLALFADGAFNSIDLVFYLLDELVARDCITADDVDAYFAKLPDQVKR
jgi:FkbM family methyltransferase